jgi:hypothetical protein
MITWTEIAAWLPSALGAIPGGVWVLWCLLCVRWQDVWPVLARGGWLAVVLLGLLAAGLWTALFPRPLLGLPPFAGQSLAVALLILVALVCGWLQGTLLAPPATSGDPGRSPR